MKTFAALIASFALCQTADAQPLRPGDRAYGQTELTEMLVDHAVEFFDGSISRYRADGAYSYKYTESDRPYLGRYSVQADGVVCVQFLSGAARCDTFVSDGLRMVLVIADGTRFPVRMRRPLVDGY